MAAAANASSSPIQRTVTSLEAFNIQQAIRLGGADDRVDQARLRAQGRVEGNMNGGMG